MRRILISLSALIWLSLGANAADSTVAALTAASALGGTELFYCVQSGADRKCTPAQIGTYVAPGAGALTALGVNVGTAGAFVVNGGALGAPSSGTLTSATGLPISTGLTGAGTGVLTALGQNLNGSGAISASTSPVFVTPALGTPSSGVATNLTGTAAGLTAGTVTTNANLTGPITSSGNATSVAAQTGTGTTFVMQASPTLTTPALGVATATSINGNTLTTGTYTLTGAAGKTLTFSNSITLAGTDATTMTFPTTSATIARTDAAQTFTGSQTFSGSLSVGGNFAVTVGGIAVQWNGSQLGWASAGAVTTGSTADTILTRKGAANVQHGAADAASPIAQTISFQSGSGTNISGVNATFTGSTSTGSGTAGDFIFQTGGTGAGAAVQNAQVTALTIKGATQEVRLPAIVSDAGLTDSTVCQDTTNHGLHSGSGTLGICLGTSSARYKTDIAPLAVGLTEIMALPAKSFYLDAEHGDPRKLMYGFTAEDCAKVLPKLTGFDGEGRANTCDYLGVVPVLVRAVQEQQTEIDALKRHLR